MKSETAFLTTIFPTDENYIFEYFSSLANQTFKNFDLILVNDGFRELDKIRRIFPSLAIYELKSAGNIAKNREIMISHARKANYKFAIFGDCDDYFSDNRIEVTLSKLKSNDVVFNQIIPFGQNIDEAEDYFGDRLFEGESIAADDILDKNILGFSNTGINLSCLDDFTVDFPNNLVAVDWYFFSLLLGRGKTACYTKFCTTFYRQYSENTIGFKTIDSEELRHIIKVKIVHFTTLLSDDSRYRKCLEDIKLLEKFILTNESSYLKQVNQITNPLWWELINLTEFKNENYK
ncbi:hypothetical protein FX988_03694 [Paraglaciecola mesophila]|uniref:Glycosyltransferase 2-like domain-containing protein n=1 Tax=Paraglaciecola mesophila TaxID=197222 RepID=A0A857JNJ9_9ALTE|nr:glycosyltransferase [Paraglaciecola mesophila]QHJ13433.1 hypothetical protein FX988_03694 [Paraglaciecola mesophila]